jgi:hypothetical protein
VDFDLQLAPQTVDGLGTVDMKFQSLAVSAKAIPVGPTAAEVLLKLSPAVALGTSVATADNLFISANLAGTPEINLTNAALIEGGLAFGAQAKRLSECTWIATREITDGVPDPLFTVAESSAE